MKFLCLFSLLVLCDGSPLQEAPNNVKLSSFQNGKESGFVVNWTGVENTDEADPILGYKVTILEEEVDVAFEVKEDGTLEPKKTSAIPSIVFDGKINVFFELKPSGQFVKLEPHDMMLKVWQKKAKFVYKLNSEGLVPLTAADIPALELQHDSRTIVTEIDIPANKTEALFNGAKRSHIYEVAVQAYTSKATGPLSKKTKIVNY